MMKDEELNNYTMDDEVSGDALDDFYCEVFKPKDRTGELYENQKADYGEDSYGLSSHYSGYSISPVTFILKNDIPFAEGNVIKYIVRHRDKNGIDDLKKAIDYIRIIAHDTYHTDI